MKTIHSTLLIIFFVSIASAQNFNEQKYFTGNLGTDARLLLVDYEDPNNPQFSFAAENKKSPVLAGVLSLLVPGAGEIYTEEYLKAGIFIAIEAAVITTAVIYDGKGNDKTIEFQNYADDYKNDDPTIGHNWDVIKYAKWLVQYEHNNDQELLNRILKSDDPNLPPWDQVNWTELNNAETGSHKLPPYGEQQYYELIGKYPQFSPGWNDFNSSDYHDVSPNFLFYAGERGKANDLYNIASKAVIGIYINHFLSTLDAVWSATRFNKDLAVKVRLENLQLTNRTEFVPTLYLTYSF